MQSATTPAVDPFFSNEYRGDPAGTVARMRREDPVHYLEPLGAWIVLRYDLIHRLYTDPNVTNDPNAYEHARPAPPGSELERTQTLSLFSAPPDQHARMRNLVSKALTPNAVGRMEDQVVDVIEQYAKPLCGRSGTVDLYADFFELRGEVILDAGHRSGEERQHQRAPHDAKRGQREAYAVGAQTPQREDEQVEHAATPS